MKKYFLLTLVILLTSCSSSDDSEELYRTIGHEFGHIIQFYSQGWAQFQGKGVYEQLFLGQGALVTTGIEAYGNYKKGHGFRTDNGVIKNYIKLRQYQNAVDFVQNRYGLTGPSMTYDSSITDFGVTDLLTGDIKIGPAAFDSPSILKATIIHEYTHSVDGRVFSGGSWSWKPDGDATWNYMDGISAYASEILYSGKMHINPSVIKLVTPGGFQVNPVWHRPGIIKGKFWHTIPRRF